MISPANGPAWSQATNVLCIRLDTIGDVIMTTPAIRALQQAVPGRRITLLTSSRGAAVAPLIPEIAETIVYDAPWMKATPPRPDRSTELDVLDRLRAGRFDAAVIFTVSTQSALPAALTCYLAEIPLRLAYCRENPYQLLTDWVVDRSSDATARHEAQRHLDLVAEVGATTNDTGYSLLVPDEARVYARYLLASNGINVERPWCVIHPGASAPSRRYPATSFAAAARAIARDHHWQVVFTGDVAEVPLVEEIRLAMSWPAVSLAGRLTLPELATLIEAAPVLISNNTAPVHIASAVGTPVVDLYALTNPQHTPWQVPHRVLFHDVPCKFCYKSVCPEAHHNCLRLVEPEAVVNAALELAADRTIAPPVSTPAVPELVS